MMAASRLMAAHRHRLLWFALLLAPGLAPIAARAEPPPSEKQLGAAPTGGLSQPPRLTHFVEAEAPPELATRGAAEVILTIDLDDAGKIVSVAVLQGAGAGFDEAAVAAAKQFVFAPGEANGKPVPVRITYRYRFLYVAPSPTPAPQPTQPAAQPTVPVTGRVMKKGERQPIGGIHVVFDGGPLEAVSGDDGHFALDVPPGDHKVTLLGPDVRKAPPEKLKLTLGKKVDVTYYVEIRDRYTAVVRGQRVVQEVSEITLSADELKRIPGTQGDTLKAVQNLPGVARAPFGLGQLIVWGSAPGDTRTYVDGVYIPTLYHFGGLRSTVNSEFVSALQFLPGGYGVEYGRGMGGVVEIESRRPRSDGYHGFVQIDLIDASASVEGPIGKNVSFSLGLRRSWIDLFLPLFTNSDFQLSPIYYDYQARLSAKATPRDDVDLFIFGSDDQITLKTKNPDPSLSGQFDSHTFFHRALIRWVHRFGTRATLTVTPSFGYDVPFQIKGTFGTTGFSLDVPTFEYNLRAVARVHATSWLRFDAGVDLEGNRFDLSLTLPSGTANESDNSNQNAFGAGITHDSLVMNQIQLAPFVTLDFHFWKKLTISPQLRLDNYFFVGYQGTPSAFEKSYALWEPRILLRYQFNKYVAIKGSIGVYHQAPQATSFMRAFGSPNLVPQEATHYVLGLELMPTSTLRIELTGFYKDLRDLVVGAEKPGDPPQLNDGIGRVYGGELMLRQELWKGLFGWIAYTVSRSERKDHPDDPWRLFQYDQTHILTVIASYKFGKGYQLGVRFRYVTGNPYTPVTSASFDVNTQGYQPVYGAPYSKRIPAFNQLDIRFDKTWTLRLFKMSIYLDLQNVYRANNAEGITYNYNYTKTANISGLPFLPVFGLRADF
jgi:TonB family protein